MPTAKITWEYQVGEDGWSESLWAPYTSALTELFDLARSYIIARLTWGAVGVYVPYIRVSDDINYRDSQIVPERYTTDPDKPAGWYYEKVQDPTQTPAQLFVALNVRMESGPNYRRNQMCRGIDNQVAGSILGPVQPPVWKGAFDAWAAIVKASFLFRAKNQAGNNARIPVLQVIPPLAPAVVGGVVLSQTNADIKQGAYVQLIGFRGLSNIRGKYYVQSVNAGPPITVLLQGFTPPNPVNRPAGYLQLLGQGVTPVVPSYQPITSVRADSITHRPVGRPFGQPVGRRKRRT
jgi:hypothetical protein